MSNPSRAAALRLNTLTSGGILRSPTCISPHPPTGISPHPHSVPQWPGLHGAAADQGVRTAQFTASSRELCREVRVPLRYA
eukprot:365646-Chlamydomonas_euryale.AAC.5